MSVVGLSESEKEAEKAKKREENLEKIRTRMDASFKAITKDRPSEETWDNILNTLLIFSFMSKASDLHILEDGSVILHRIMGTLKKIPFKNVTPEIIEKIIRTLVVKVRGKNSTTKTTSHEGSYLLKIPKELLNSGKSLEIACRISSIPSVTGTVLVIRFREAKDLPDLKSLGLSSGRIEILEKWVINKYSQGGVFIVTGPTGSGKSTTLLSLLKEVDKFSNHKLSIVTVEDPVEIIYPGFRQFDADTNGSYAEILVKILRQDADVVLVGEIRDSKVAESVFSFGATGHLTLTTLHTNSSIASIGRLLELGVPRSILSMGLIGIASQRLLQVLCSCKKKAPLRQSIKIKNYKIGGEVFDVSPAGCEKCNRTGIISRTPVIEILLNTKGLQQAIAEGASLKEIEKIAKEQEMKTMLDHAMEKVVAGTVSIYEVERVLVRACD